VRALYAILSAGLLAAPSAWGHEFWIEPRAHHVAPEDRIEADLRIGEMMTGNPYPFLPDFIVEASITGPQSKESLIGTVGDLPALSVVAPAAPGLYALSYHSTPSYVTFDDLESFSEYLDYEGLVKIVGEHLERQLPDTSISEAYIRNARTLVQVGDIDELDKDRPGSMPFEIIALSNPFTGTAEVSFQLLWRGQPAVDVQMSIFQRPLGDDDREKVTRSLVRTNAEGIAALDVASGGHFLLNAVQMVAVEGPGSVVWESHWASLTFTLDQ